MQISEEVPNIQIKCDSDLYIYKEEKNSKHTWIFNVVTTVSIIRYF